MAKRPREDEDKLDDMCGRLQRLKTVQSAQAAEAENQFQGSQAAYALPLGYESAAAAAASAVVAAGDPLRPTNQLMGRPFAVEADLQKPAALQQPAAQQAALLGPEMLWDSYDQASKVLRALHFERLQRLGLQSTPS